MSFKGGPPLVGYGVTNPVQIMLPYVTTMDVDKNIDVILKPFREDGRSSKYGVMIIGLLPHSRPRPYDPKVKRQEPTSLMVTKSTVVACLTGCYVLKETEEKVDITWLSKAENSGVGGPHITNQYILSLIGYGGPLGERMRVPEDNGALRVFLGLKRFPFILDRLPHQMDINPDCKGLKSTVFDIHTAGSVTLVQTPLAGLMQVIYHHRGAAQMWIVVPPGENVKLEVMLRKMFNIGIPTVAECPQFLRHLSVFLTEDLLRSWDIFFIQVRLEEGRSMIVFEGTYFWGHSTGFAILESKHLPGPYFVFDRHNLCSPEKQLCSGVITHVDYSSNLPPNNGNSQGFNSHAHYSSDQEMLREFEMDRLCRENSSLREGIDLMVAERNSLIRSNMELQAENEKLRAELVFRYRLINKLRSQNKLLGGHGIESSQHSTTKEAEHEGNRENSPDMEDDGAVEE